MQGDTGAGKSSMLNALLGEQQIVPTNGMRACTAAIIELRANTAEQPGYSGEVEFVSREAWAKDEAELWKQLTNEDGSLMLECPKEGTPAHEAWWVQHGIQLPLMLSSQTVLDLAPSVTVHEAH